MCWIKTRQLSLQKCAEKRLLLLRLQGSLVIIILTKIQIPEDCVLRGFIIPKFFKIREENMGRYLNQGNEVFARSVNSEIYIDKTGLLQYTNRVINTQQSYVCVIAEAAISENFFQDLRFFKV